MVTNVESITKRYPWKEANRLFALGVKSVNPEATINVRWTNTWIDPAKAKENHT